MVTWARVFLSLAVLASIAPQLGAQSGGSASDTVASQLLIDSLLAAGWRAPPQPAGDTVELPPDTIVVAASSPVDWIPLVSVAVGMLALAGLAFLTYLAATRLFRAIDRRSSIGVRSHWGGLGGGNEGWEVSPALSMAVVTIILAILTTVVATAVLGVADGGDAAGGAEVTQDME
jgi:hypothetical protein